MARPRGGGSTRTRLTFGSQGTHWHRAREQTSLEGATESGHVYESTHNGLGCRGDVVLEALSPIHEWDLGSGGRPNQGYMRSA